MFIIREWFSILGVFPRLPCRKTYVSSYKQAARAIGHSSGAKYISMATKRSSNFLLPPFIIQPVHYKTVSTTCVV
jgi:hypothetical protein